MANLEDNEFKTAQPKSKHQRRVERFMQLAGQELPDRPFLPDLETRKLRANLILEEATETIKALGFSLGFDYGDNIVLVDDCKPDLEQIIDGCSDLSVVTIGTLSACGIPDEAVLKITDENNLAKFGAGGYRREDGKWIKPPDHKPPDYSEVLNGVAYGHKNC